MANIENCFIKSKVDFRAAGGSLQRLVRPNALTTGMSVLRHITLFGSAIASLNCRPLGRYTCDSISSSIQPMLSKRIW